MKNKATKEAVFHSLITNLIIVAILIAVGFYFVIPEYRISESHKIWVHNAKDKHTRLLSSWLTFDEFKEVYAAGSDLYTWENLDLFNSILTDFREDDFNNYFTHTWSVYEDFIEKQILDAKEKRITQISTGLDSSIAEILPEYSWDSSLVTNSLTDFKFINHIEWLLDTFQLSTDSVIWIWELTDTSNVDENELNATIKENPLNGIIYEGVISLDLIWDKKNVINFIHYIENVWKINVENKEITLYEPSKIKVIKNPEGVITYRNNFLDMPKFINNDADIYNKLIMEVEEFYSEDYLDSSDLPTKNWYDFIQFIKEDQWTKRFEFSLKIKYYVKGLPTFKIDSFITNLQWRYTELLKITQEAFEDVNKNRSSLNDNQAIASMWSLENLNKYLLWIQSDIEAMRSSFEKKEDLGTLYKDAQDLKSVFEIITNKLKVDLESVSETLYEQHKTILDKTID